MSTTVDVQETHDVVPQDSVLLIDLGKHSRKQIKRLRRGQGKLLDEVQKCMQELRTAGTLAESAVPVVVLVREKRDPFRLF
jgi:Family of unknown function (DUF6200)